MLKQGTKLSNRYTISNVHSHSGGMSTIYQGYDEKLRAVRAIKEVTKPGINATPAELNYYKAILNEVNLLRTLSNPYILTIYDVIETDDSAYIIEEFLDGQTLTDVMTEAIAERHAIDQDTVVKWSKQLAEALAYLHHRSPAIIHKDIKPGNVMVRPNGNITLFDFGISATIDQGIPGGTERVVSRGYSAPELYEKQPWFDTRADVFSLGRLMYVMLTGRSPVVQGKEVELVPLLDAEPSVSTGLARVVEKAMKAAPAERYQSIDDFIIDLDNYHELDVSSIKKNNRKLFTTYALAGLGIVSLLLGLGNDFRYANAEQNRYNAYVSNGLATEDAGELHKALEIKGDNLDVYKNLITYAKQDGIFTSEEELPIREALIENEAAIKNKDGYPELAYELGKAYWFYYGNDPETMDINLDGRNLATYWFNKATTSKDTNVKFMSDNYLTLGNFYKTLTQNVEEASDRGMYKEAFDALGNLIADSAMPELAKLENVRANHSFIALYIRQLVADGLTEKDLTERLNLVKDVLNNTEVTTDKTTKLKEFLLEQPAELETILQQQFHPEVREPVEQADQAQAESQEG